MYEIELPARPANQAEIDVRLSTYLGSWRSVARSTEPADRPAAEAAIDALYRNVGRKPPRIIWVPSPLVGTLAYLAISNALRSLTSPYAKGDVGTGDRREFHGLRDPFGFPTYAERTVPERLRQRGTDAQGSSIVRTRDAAARTRETIRAELLRTAPLVIEEHIRVDPAPVKLDGPLGEMLLGSSAEPFSRLVGPDVFSIVAGAAVRHAFVTDLQEGSMTWAAQSMQPGQFDADALYWAAIESVFGRPFYSPQDGSVAHRDRLALRLQLARAAGPWWALDGVAIVSERPLVVAHDGEGRLHAEDGPALAFGDGYAVHAWHGVAVERDVIESPESITIAAIDREGNAELRRVLVERFGFDRLVREGNATLRHEDETGRLWERPMGSIDWWRKDEPMVMVEVHNSTPEADGSRKTYFLRVPPRTQTAREGVAWTFGLTADEYVPAVET